MSEPLRKVYVLHLNEDEYHWLMACHSCTLAKVIGRLDLLIRYTQVQAIMAREPNFDDMVSKLSEKFHKLSPGDTVLTDQTGTKL